MKQLWTLLTAVCLVATASADVHIEFKFTRTQTGMGQDKTENGVHHCWVKRDKVAKLNHKGKTEITRFDKQLTYKIYAKRKNYTVKTFEQIKQRNADRLKRSAAGKQKHTFTVTVADAEVEIAGHKTRHYTMLRNGNKFFEIWACEALDKENYFHKMMLLKSLPDKKSTEEVGKIKGVWLKWQMTFTGPGFTIREEGVATKVSTDAVDDKVFELPDGFTERS